MRPAGVLFDKDGTLVDFDRSWGRAVLPAMRAIGGGDPAVIRELAALVQFDLGTRRIAPTSLLIGGSTADLAAAWCEPLGRPLDEALIADIDAAFAAAVLRELQPIGDPGAVLDALLGRGLRIGVATNDAEASARVQLAKLGLAERLPFVAGYDSGHGGKPGPGMVLAFAAALGVEPRGVMMVGDTPHDMLAARAAGAVGVAVLSGPVGREVLAPLADHVVGSIADLPALVDRLA